MEYICLVKRENTAKAEEKLRKDFDLASKQSITIKDAKSAGTNLEGNIFFIRGSDEGVNHCKALLKEFVVNTSEAELKKARTNIIKEEESAAEGFGGIFG